MTTQTTLTARIAQVNRQYKPQIKGFTTALDGFATANDALASIQFPEGTTTGDIYDSITIAIGAFRKYAIPVVENTSKNSEGTLAFDTTHTSYEAARKARARFMRLFAAEKPEGNKNQVEVPPEVLALARKLAGAAQKVDAKTARKIASAAIALAFAK